MARFKRAKTLAVATLSPRGGDQLVTRGWGYKSLGRV